MGDCPIYEVRNGSQRAQPAPAADPGGQLVGQERRTGWIAGKPVPGSHAGQEAAHAGDGGAGQQDGEDRLGADGARRNLQSSGRGGVTTVAARGGQGGKEGQRRGMAQRSEDGVGKTSEKSKRLERAKAVWTRSAISIQASGHVNGRIRRPGTRKHRNPRTTTSRKTSCIRRGVHTRTLAPFTETRHAGSGVEPPPAPLRDHLHLAIHNLDRGVVADRVGRAVQLCCPALSVGHGVLRQGRVVEVWED